jgi:hypothetical protein
MSKAQLIQLLISMIGIVLAVLAFLFLPFGMVVNGIIAFVIFVAAGTAASFAYARIASIDEKIRDLRDRVDNPPA